MTEPHAAISTDRDILTASSPFAAIEHLSGGKGRGLFELTAQGMPVPAWAVVSVDVFRRFRIGAGLDALIRSEMAGLAADSDEEALNAAAEQISAVIAEADLDSRTQTVLAEAYANVGEGAVAVRSSAVGEDNARLSFAGQYTTLLNVVGLDAVTEAVRSCWSSAWSAAALRYRLMNNLSLQGVEMAVVIQAIVVAEKSGVLFTVNPATGRDDEFVISAAYGLGEAVVSGAVDSDTVVLARATGALREQRLGDKDKRIDPLPDGGCATRAVPGSERSAAALSAAELVELHQLGTMIERLMDSPQDIEWALAEGKLWILQSRPVTSTPRSYPSSDGKLCLWDNSNIIESYGEIVAPLTYSFARHAYHRVYLQYCELLGVPPRQLKRIEEWLPQLLGYFDGRVYYNLLNWYRLARLSPFYSMSRRVLEISMGTEPLDEGIAARQQPYLFRNRIEGILVRTRVAAHFFWYFATIHRLVGDFVDRFYSEYNELDALDYRGHEAHVLYSMFVDMERRLLVRWGRMIMLEYSIGLSLGTLYMLTQRWLPDAPEWFFFEVIKTAPDLESVQPLHRLDEIAETIAADRALLEQVRSVPAERLDSVLRGTKESSTLSLVKQIDAYLDAFGYRNANELKLEEPDLREDPTTFFALLKSAVGRLEAGEATADQERPTADAYLSIHLRGWRRRVYELLRRRVQRLLIDRERVRFCRTRIFGLSRRMFRAAGEDLARSRVLEAASDIFYLRLEELRGCFEGTIAHRELGSLVALRKDQELRNRERDLPHRFWTRGGVYWDALDRAWAEASKSEASEDGLLRGTPCSPGIVRGEARVIKRPADVGGGVMVTYRTDPGWVGVLRSASALLIERGSPLTHVAVVARELGIPTVVQIPGLTQQIRSGMYITVDGSTGTIKLPGMEGARVNGG
jgi:phosphohistidine swiveling domain-containing protein